MTCRCKELYQYFRFCRLILSIWMLSEWIIWHCELGYDVRPFSNKPDFGHLSTFCCVWLIERGWLCVSRGSPELTRGGDKSRDFTWLELHSGEKETGRVESHAWLKSVPTHWLFLVEKSMSEIEMQNWHPAFAITTRSMSIYVLCVRARTLITNNTTNNTKIPAIRWY